MTGYVLHTLVGWWPLDGITIGSHVWIKKQFQGNQVLLQHELVHVRQFAELGVLGYFFRYFLLLPLFWNPWRVRLEAEAYAVQVRAGISLDWAAATLSGWRYGWPCRRDRAATDIRRYAGTP